MLNNKLEIHCNTSPDCKHFIGPIRIPLFTNYAAPKSENKPNLIMIKS